MHVIFPVVLDPFRVYLESPSFWTGQAVGIAAVHCHDAPVDAMARDDYLGMNVKVGLMANNSLRQLDRNTVGLGFLRYVLPYLRP